jgi:hypothetical protein
VHSIDEVRRASAGGAPTETTRVTSRAPSDRAFALSWQVRSVPASRSWGGLGVILAVPFSSAVATLIDAPSSTTIDPAHQHGAGAFGSRVQHPK